MTQRRHCTSCGYQNTATAQFCIDCGQPVPTAPPPTPTQAGNPIAPSGMRVIARICWIFSAVAAVIGLITLVAGLSVAESAPQEASVASIALGIAAIPYVLARAMHKLLPNKPP